MLAQVTGANLSRSKPRASEWKSHSKALRCAGLCAFFGKACPVQRLPPQQVTWPRLAASAINLDCFCF
jgi:hypothetical protein